MSLPCSKNAVVERTVVVRYSIAKQNGNNIWSTVLNCYLTIHRPHDLANRNVHETQFYFASFLSICPVAPPPQHQRSQQFRPASPHILLSIS